MRAAGLICAVAWVLCACKDPLPAKPIAGLHSAANAVQVGGKSLAVGSQLMPSDELRATGPAVIEFYGGAIRFLDKGDTITVGDTEEAQLVGANIPEKLVEHGKVRDAEKARRPIAARYVGAQFTPESAGTKDLGTGDYLAAFFTPHGIANLGKDRDGSAPDGPRRPLPPPPNRVSVPHVHAGELGSGGPLAHIDDGFAAAETPQLTSAVLLEDQTYDLGTATRLLLPDGAELTLTFPDGAKLELEGPGDFRLR